MGPTNLALSPHALRLLTTRNFSLVKIAATLHLSFEYAVTNAGPQVTLRPDRLLVRDLYDAVERDYTVNGRKDLVNLQLRWRNHLRDAFGAMPVSAVTSEHVSVYIAKRLEDGAKNATINRELSILKRCYLLAIETGKLKFGERPYIGMLKENNVRKGFVKDEQYKPLARATGEIGLWLRTLFELGFCYAWRKGELLGLRVSQVDMVERTIVLHAGETKNKDGRWVTMTDTIHELLAGLVAGKAPEDFVFTRTLRDGRIKRVRYFGKTWAKATATAGCPGLLFHDLRRSAARNMSDAEIPDKTAMEIGGWKTRAVYDRYNITSRENIRKAVLKIGKGATERRNKGLFEQAELPLQDGTPRKPAASDRPLRQEKTPLVK